MFSFRESYFLLVGLFDWGYARMQFLLSVSRNRYGFTLAGYWNEKSATDPALVLILYLYIHFLSLRSYFIYLNIIWILFK